MSGPDIFSSDDARAAPRASIADHPFMLGALVPNDANAIEQLLFVAEHLARAAADEVDFGNRTPANDTASVMANTAIEKIIAARSLLFAHWSDSEQFNRLQTIGQALDTLDAHDQSDVAELAKTIRAELTAILMPRVAS